MTDLDIIQQIEKELDVKLEKLDEIEWGSKGYTLNQKNQVSGIGLNECNIEKLDRIIALLQALTNLTQLYLSGIQISDLAPLQALTKTNLTQLDLSFNQLSDLAPLQALTNLTHLSLSGNQICDLAPLKDLKQLKTLHLRENRIEELPAWITDFNMKIRWENGYEDGYIYLGDNPLKNPPPEIVKQGKAAIMNYFEQLQEQEVDYLFEAKMLIVGETGKDMFDERYGMNIEHADTVIFQQTEKGDNIMGNNKKSDDQVTSSWANGSFFLFAFLLVMSLIGIIAYSISAYTLALIIVGGILIVPVIGAFQL